MGKNNMRQFEPVLKQFPVIILKLKGFIFNTATHAWKLTAPLRQRGRFAVDLAL